MKKPRGRWNERMKNANEKTKNNEIQTSISNESKPLKKRNTCDGIVTTMIIGKLDDEKLAFKS